MNSEANKYFKYLDIVREDIREELDLLGVHQKATRICDFGCGNGITTFGLALEVDESVCIGLDLFTKEARRGAFWQRKVAYRTEAYPAKYAVRRVDVCG